MSAHVGASSDVSFSGRLGHTKHQRFNVFGGGRRVPQHRIFWMAMRRSLKCRPWLQSLQKRPWRASAYQGKRKVVAKWQRRSMEACAIEPAAEDAHGLPEGAQKAVAIEAATPSRWSWYLRKDGQQQDLPQPHSFVVSCWLIFRNSLNKQVRSHGDTHRIAETSACK